MIVCLDTHILIWGIKREASPGQEPEIERAARFLQWLENKRHTVLIPSPVLGEFLMRVPPQAHSNVLSLFHAHFIVPPYDALCASQFARIWQHKNGLKSGELSRREIKVDSMIVAVAIVQQAEAIYSNDDGLRKVAQGLIDVRPMPALPRQLSISGV